MQIGFWVCIVWNERTFQNGYTLLYFHSYCEIKTWTCLSRVSQEAFWIIPCSKERIETFEKRNKIISCQCRYRTCGAVDIILNTFLSTRPSPIQIAKLRKPICHISHAFIFQISIQSKTKQTIIQQNDALQQQYCCAATDMWMQFSHETFFLQN